MQALQEEYQGISLIKLTISDILKALLSRLCISYQGLIIFIYVAAIGAQSDLLSQFLSLDAEELGLKVPKTGAAVHKAIHSKMIEHFGERAVLPDDQTHQAVLGISACKCCIYYKLVDLLFICLK